MRDIAMNPICTPILMDSKDANEEDDLYQEVGIHSAIAVIRERVRYICGCIFATKDS